MSTDDTTDGPLEGTAIGETKTVTEQVTLDGINIATEHYYGSDRLSDDVERAEFKQAGDCDITYTEESDVVSVTATDSVAAKQLYDWLEETRQYYKENYVDASGEHDAARQLADAVYEKMSK